MVENNGYQLRTYTRNNGVVRVLVSEPVLVDLPIFDAVMERLVKVDFVEWPDGFVVMRQGAPPPANADYPQIVFGEWVFEQMRDQWSKPLGLIHRLAGTRVIDRAAPSFAWIFAHYFKPTEGRSKEDAVSVAGVFLRFDMDGAHFSKCRMVRLLVGFVILIPYFIAVLAFIYPAAVLMPRNKNILIRLAYIQNAFTRRKGLRNTQRKMLAAGVPLDIVRSFDLQPDLQIVDDGDDSK